MTLPSAPRVNLYVARRFYFATPTTLRVLYLHSRPLGDYALLFPCTGWQIHYYRYLSLHETKSLSGGTVLYTLLWQIHIQQPVFFFPLNPAPRHSLKHFFSLWTASDTCLREDRENTNDRIYVFIYINHHGAQLLFQRGRLCDAGKGVKLMKHWWR